MPRHVLTEQPTYEYCHSLTVRTTDINYAGHLGNEALLGFVHEARACFLRELSFETIMGNSQKIGLIIADLVVNYKAEAYAYDHLEVDCQIDEMTQKSFRLLHRIRRGAQVIALVETGVIAYDYATRQTVSLPPAFLTGLHAHRAGLKKKSGDLS